MDNVQSLGTTKDMQDRESLARRDESERLEAVRDARDLIYRQNLAVTTPQVEALLKPASLVPTLVSSF